MLNASSLVGGSGRRGRVELDYYATPEESTKALLGVEEFKGTVLEPCVGAGHIADVVIGTEGVTDVIGVDIVDRGWKGTIAQNFFDYQPVGAIDHVITNPPYSLAQKFLEHSMDIVKDNGKIAMFLKIQFLEGKARKELFKKYPPKKVYVFSERQSPYRNGEKTDENGKKWNSTMCFAWFVWEKGFKGEPKINWL